MKKIHLNLSVDEDLVDNARNHGLVISKFLKNKLQEYLNFIDAVSNPKKLSKNEEWTCRGQYPLSPVKKINRMRFLALLVF